MQPNALSRKLNVSLERLILEYGIQYKAERGHDGRKIRLAFVGKQVWRYVTVVTVFYICLLYTSHHEVISIHPERKTVSVKNLENGEIFEENYDKLILSPGAKPTQPRLPGVGIDKLFTLRTVEDTFRIKEYINKNHPKSAVLAGGGFIGLEPVSYTHLPL